MPKTELNLEKPVMNAAGMLGFSPDPKGPVDITRLGAFVSNPVSWARRSPAKGQRYLPYSGGFLLHTGYPNPGLTFIIRKHARRWARSPVPVIVHLLAQDGGTLGAMVQRLETVEGVMGVEIGLPPDGDPDLVYEMTLAAVGELAVVVRLPFETALREGGTSPVVEAITAAGISAVSLAPPRGILPGPDGALVSGRLYGPGLFPLALAAVEKLAALGLPVIGAGGVYSQQEARVMQAAGALAVQLDAVLWRGENAQT